MENQQEASIFRSKKVFALIAVIAAGVAICVGMKTFICGRTGQECKC